MGRLLGISIALVCLVITPGLLFYFDITPKIVLLLAGTAAALVWAAISGLRVRLQSRTFLAFSVVLFVSVVSLAVSTAFSARPELSLFGSNWRRYGSIAQAAVYLFAWLVSLGCSGHPERLRTLLRAVSVSGALSALYGICQFFGFDPLLSPASYHVGEGATMIVRPPGTLGYSSYFATWLLFVVFLSLALQSMESVRAWRWIAACSAILAGCATLLTGTRAAILGLIAGAIVWKLVERAPIRRPAWIGAGVAAAVLALLFFTPAGQPLRARVRWSTDDAWGGARLTLWRDSLEMAMRRPAAGYGPEVFTATFPEYQSLQLAQAYPDFAHESTHNMFLDAFVAQGAPGLLLLIGVCALGLFVTFRLRQPAFAAALAAGIVSQQFTAFTMPTALILLSTVGLVVASDTEAAAPRRRGLLIGSAAAVALVLLYMAVRLGAADYALAMTQRALDRADLAAASQQYRRYEQLRLPGASADIWYSRALLDLASQSSRIPVKQDAMAQSAAAALLATRTAEDPFNAWYNLATVCGFEQNADCVEHSLRMAIDAHPKWFKPHWALAQLLVLRGQLNEALREATLAAELDGNKHPEVTGVLEKIRAQLAHPQSALLRK